MVETKKTNMSIKNTPPKKQQKPRKQQEPKKPTAPFNFGIQKNPEENEQNAPSPSEQAKNIYIDSEALVKSVKQSVPELEWSEPENLANSKWPAENKPNAPSPSEQAQGAEIVYKSVDVLGDSISECKLIDFMGSDDSIVKAARISTDRESVETGKEKLIGYLLKHKHGTPFEHNSLTFRIVAPVFVARQWFRHRIGWSYNEQSRRYTSENVRFYTPQETEWRKQHKTNRQASGSEVIDEKTGAVLTALLEQHSGDSLRLYNAALDAGASREQARFFLPVNLYTEFFVTCNLRSLMAFCSERDAPDAQKEIAVYARAMASVAEQLFPIAWAAYKGLRAA